MKAIGNNAIHLIFTNTRNLERNLEHVCEKTLWDILFLDTI
jgi:hypothetical protein